MEKTPQCHKCFNLNCKETALSDSLNSPKNAALFNCLFSKKNTLNTPLNKLCSLKQISHLIFNYAREPSGKYHKISFLPNIPSTDFNCYFCTKHMNTIEQLDNIMLVMNEHSKFTVKIGEQKVESIELDNMHQWRRKLVGLNLFDFTYFNFDLQSGEHLSLDLIKDCPQFQLFIKCLRIAHQKLSDVMV